MYILHHVPPLAWALGRRPVAHAPGPALTPSGNSTPARWDVGSSPSTLATRAAAVNTQPVQEASSSRLPTIRARGKRQLGELYL